MRRSLVELVLPLLGVCTTIYVLGTYPIVGACVLAGFFLYVVAKVVV